MKIPRGIRITDRKVGTGPAAETGKTAVIHYDCYLPRGEKCFSSRDRSVPARFRVGRREVYPGIDYGVIGMSVGGVRSIRVSPHLTYYERRLKPDLPDNAVLRYEVELLAVGDRWEDTLHMEAGPGCGGACNGSGDP